MNHKAILSDLARYESQQAFIEAANAVEYSPRTYFASVRTVYNLLGAQAANALVSALEAADPIAAAMFRIPGDEKGTGGGIDLSLPQAQAMLDYFTTTTPPILSVEQATVIKDLGRVISANAMTRYGVETVTAETIALATQMAANEAMNDMLAEQEREAASVWNATKSLIDRRREYLNTHLDTISTIEQLNAAVPE